MILLNRLFGLILVFLVWLLVGSHAEAACGFSGCTFDETMSSKSTSNPSYPTSSSRITSNPSSVPTAVTTGLEILFYGSSPDFVLVKGIGWAGASISPSNFEESFFGAPVQEIPEQQLIRKTNRTKYKSQKTNIATAFEMYDNKKSGISHFNVNFGVIGKYNSLTKLVMPGFGFSGTFGNIVWGWALATDRTVLDYNTQYGLPSQTYLYATESYSFGLVLDKVILDYSMLSIPALEPISVQVITGAVFFSNWILTLSRRQETSNRLYYDYTTKGFLSSQIKTSAFMGLQYKYNKNFVVSGLYNYFLLNEISLATTWFL